MTHFLQACFLRYQGNAYEAYKGFIEAEEHKFACDIAILDLVPEVVIRQDYTLLHSIFHALKSDKIDDWSVRGKVRFLFGLCVIIVLNHTLSYSLITPT